MEMTEEQRSPRFDVVSLGESMLRLSVPIGARLDDARALDVEIGGAEGNVCVALARLGRRTAWLGALPANPLGRLAANALRGAGVDYGGVHWCEGGRMGTYFVEFSTPPRPIQVIYDRARSCMAEFSTKQVDWPRLLDTRLLHLTGITPALSPSCRAVAETAVQQAQATGVPISFDVNFRQKLWDAETAAAALAPLLRQSTVVFCGHGDAQRLFGCAGDPPAALRQLAEQPLTAGAQVVVMSIGAAGALAWHKGEVLHVDDVPTAIVDRLGAGDALAAGVLHGWLDGDLPRGLRVGVVLAALALAQHGDMVRTTPEEVAALLESAGGMIVR